ELGRKLFNGQGASRIPTGNRICATCHTPTLTLEYPVFMVEDPDIPTGTEKEVCPEEALPSLINPVSGDRLPVNKLFRLASQRAVALRPGARPGDAILEAAQAGLPRSYLINLTDPGKDIPGYVYPRLKPSSAGPAVDVPLFSDLRTHDMGEGLKDVA